MITQKILISLFCVFIIGSLILILGLNFIIRDFERAKHKSTINLMSQMEISLVNANRELSDYINLIEVIERKQREIVERDSLIRDMIKKIEETRIFVPQGVK